MIEGFRQWRNWSFLLACVDLGAPIYYKAPFDLVPKRVRVARVGHLIRVWPLYGSDFDTFKADETHLERFHMLDQAPSSEVRL